MDEVSGAEMSESRKNSGVFFLLGVLAFLAGVAFWIISGRGSAAVNFACSSVVFAVAWFFERMRKRSEGNQD
ncbi:hypothetical protein [Streptomyces sp. NPDC059575]|uniref:hypothetical protein n=1 Tax=Streptomyces sp. NPDC059575 TaxID=3346872 RepID=UPI00369CBA7F